jgi:hypothetical protein
MLRFQPTKVEEAFKFLVSFPFRDLQRISLIKACREVLVLFCITKPNRLKIHLPIVLCELGI